MVCLEPNGRVLEGNEEGEEGEEALGVGVGNGADGGRGAGVHVGVSMVLDFCK